LAVDKPDELIDSQARFGGGMYVVKDWGVFTAISGFALGWRQSYLANNVIVRYSNS